VIKIFINGFGRIGESIYTLIKDDSNFEIVGINELNPIKVDDIPIFSEKEPKNLNLNGVDILIQATGAFLKKKQNEAFLKAGAKKVLITAPSDAPTFIYGINHNSYRGEKIISASSCSATATVPVIKAFEEFEPKSCYALMIHSYTNDQVLLDRAKNYMDIRKTRSATLNILPLYSTAPKAIKRFFPSLKIEAKSIRVPLAYSTFYDITLITKNEVKNFEEIIKKSLPYTYEKVVSSDIKGKKEPIVIDMEFSFKDKKMLKICGWQDNEIGYSFQVVKLIKKISSYTKEISIVKKL
jgi:glyceraldehyde 3-phosphate dehydrogenase